MLTKIKALLMAIYLFFMCIPYGNSPIDIKMTEPTLTVCGTVYELKDDMEPIKVSAGILDVLGSSPFSFSAKCENVGRPFKGHEPFHPVVALYKVENGKRSFIDLLIVYDECVPRDVLIKNGDTLNVHEQFSFTQIPSETIEPGVYNLEISVYGCKTVFEDVIVIK